ncbi:hypothetical protein OG426_40880 [Streptomyces canus]|uniref:hypothetical protein n=1 Tax=Streptomyces canus TaxID=58343 RepID=UPI0022553C33|nr:hypothetical protein [Streptomyces canus]MCX4856161.1 hypothetical protein [Streptomyces canus]WSW38361.1 hypothetical protein OG426_40880 [Streptomyces canus]
MADFPQPSSPPGAIARRLLPPPALCGFLLLLAFVFSVSYAVGSAAGPVAPGIHGTGNAGSGNGGGGGDGGSGSDMEDMPAMTDGSGH